MLLRLLPFVCALASAQTLTVGGDVSEPLKLTRAELASMPRTAAILGERPKVNYEGVLLYEIGYEALYAIAEADPAFTNANLLVADTADGKPILDDSGPFPSSRPPIRKARARFGCSSGSPWFE